MVEDGKGHEGSPFDAEVESCDDVVNESSVRKALFAAVEGGPDGTEELLSYRPLVNLFFFPESDTTQYGVHMAPRAKRDVTLKYIRSRKFQQGGHARRLFSSLGDILSEVVDQEAFIPVSVYESEEEIENDGKVSLNGSITERRKSSNSITNPSEIVPDEDSTEALLFMKACALILHSYLDGLVDRRTADKSSNKLYRVVEEAFVIGQQLHGVLFSLQSYCGAEGVLVFTAVATLCEKWWHKRFVGRDEMVVQLIPLLIVRSLHGMAQKSDVKRLYMIKEAFQLFDFEDEDITFTRSLILRTVSSPLFLQMLEGKKTIAYVFTLHESLVRDLHNSIRAQIPRAKKSTLSSYGEIYFRAWNECSSECEARLLIENLALQDLVFAAVHATSATMFRSIQAVLSPFYDSKSKSRDVQKLLYKMYEPILWRSLKATNPAVRVNAAHVLAEVFPLYHPFAGDLQLKKSISVAVNCLNELLRDSDVKVRIAGSAATAKILATFWDILPAASIRALLTNIVMEHSSDASSSAVRTAAISAVSTVLEAPQSHGVLRALLPSLGNLIHDKIERVRLALVRLLQRIKTIKGIKYYHVVPVDHLLARLSEEGTHQNPNGPVASALTSLLLNSYYPQGDRVSNAEQLERTVAFLGSHPTASSIFYSNLAAHLGTNSVSKLIVMLFRCLIAGVDADKIQSTDLRQIKQGSAPKDDRESEEANASKTSLMALVTETICILWNSIESKLLDPRNQACKQFLLANFSGGALTRALLYFEAKLSSEEGRESKTNSLRISTAILRCAARLPPETAEGMVSHVSCVLQGDLEVLEHLSSYVSLLCRWGFTEDASRSLASSMAAFFGPSCSLSNASFDRVPDSNKRKPTRSAVAKEEQSLSCFRLPPQTALDILFNILSKDSPCDVAARKLIVGNKASCSTLEEALEQATVRAERILLMNKETGREYKEKDVLFILKACEAYGKLAMHKEASANTPLVFGAEMRTLLSWTSEKVVNSILSNGQDSESSLRDLNISRISSVTDSPLVPSSPVPTEPPRQKANRNKTPQRFDVSFDSLDAHIDMDFIGENEGNKHVAVAASFSLLKSSCTIFSEWIAVGGSASEVEREALSWFQIFSASAASHKLKRALLATFCRLAVLVCLNAGNFDFLKELIINCNSMTEDDDEAMIETTVTALLSTRTQKVSSSVERTVQSLLAAFCEIVAKRTQMTPTGREPMELPAECIDLCWGEKGSFHAALSAIFSNRRASSILGEKLVEKLLQFSQESSSPAIFTFQANCLWLILESLPRGYNGELLVSIRRLETVDCGDDTKAVVDQLLEECS